MRPTEITWRVRRLVQGVAAPTLERPGVTHGLPTDDATWERWLEAFRRAEGRPVLLDREGARHVAATRPEEVAALVAAAEGVVAGRVHYFGYPAATLGSPVDWHHDAVSGYDWPRVAARRIDHRTAPADPKWIWELNRLQHLPWLAEAWLFTGREEFAETAFEHLDSWLDQNPVGQGIAWRGAFEAGVRAISVLLALQGLRDSPALTPQRFRRVVAMLEASGRTCWRERSLFSSANNHLVGEVAGLATIGLLLPELPRSRRWVRRALDLLADESDLQVLPDGAGAEQAVGYQIFTAELFLVVMLLAQGSDDAADLRSTTRLAAAVRRSSAYLAAVVGTDDPAPRYGDDDEGFALRLGPEPVRSVRDHLAVVGAWGREATGPGLTAAWVAEATAASRTPALLAEDPPTGSSYAADGGLVVLRAGTQRVTMDVAPLGYLSLAAHGHADALTLTLAVDGSALIDDPGTGSYYGHPEWRAVHRGTPAHATLAVDGEDQSVLAGAFMWSRHAQVTVHEVDLDRGIVDAEHDGYQRLDEPVTHRRRVEASRDGDGFVVVDVLLGAGRHRASVSWPLAPDLTATAVPDGHTVLRDGSPVLQIATAATVPLEHARVVGDEQSHLGWWSDRLESRRPAYLLTSVGEGAVPLVIATVVRRVGPEGRGPVTGLGVEVVGEDVVVRWTEGDEPDQTTLPKGVRRPPGGH